MLTQIAALTRIDLATGIIEVMIFDKRTELRRPIVVRACDDLPGEVRMIFPSATAKIVILALKLETRRFRIIDADPGAEIRLEFLVSRCESQYEVRHECARVDPLVRLLLRNTSPSGSLNVKWRHRESHCKRNRLQPLDELRPCQRRSRAYAAEKADVILRAKRESVSKLICENSVSAAVLINVGPHIDCSVKARRIKSLTVE
jgi:hypothetical protein